MDVISRDESAEDADILMYCPENGTLHIIETTLGEEQFEELLPGTYGADKNRTSGI